MNHPSSCEYRFQTIFKIFHLDLFVYHHLYVKVQGLAVDRASHHLRDPSPESKPARRPPRVNDPISAAMTANHAAGWCLASFMPRVQRRHSLWEKWFTNSRLNLEDKVNPQLYRVWCWKSPTRKLHLLVDIVCVTRPLGRSKHIHMERQSAPAQPTWNLMYVV